MPWNSTIVVRLIHNWMKAVRPGPGQVAAADVAAVADALGIERFAVFGHSSGGSHALACGALLPDRVVAVVSAAGLAPFGADGLDWFAGMSDASLGSLHADAAGRAAKEAYEAREDNRELEFAPADLAAFDGSWGWFGSVVRPILLLHGGVDTTVLAAHAHWLAAHCPTAERRIAPREGHISVLNGAPEALRWLAEQR
jgi:pimeloyl-ACP methyl ester carboxylesterase